MRIELSAKVGLGAGGAAFLLVMTVLFLLPVDVLPERLFCSDDEHLVMEKSETYGTERSTERMRCCAPRSDDRPWGKCNWIEPLSGVELVLLGFSAAVGWLVGCVATVVMLVRRRRHRA